jgi:hypothetical protein
MIEEKGIITIAIGRKYIRQAKYLAYSAMLNAPNVLRAVITDKPDKLWKFYDFIIAYKKEYGDPFATKTRLHLYTPFYKTIFVDSDSLIMNSVDSYWEILNGNSLAYEGKLISDGYWYLDVKELIEKIQVPSIPKINSGFFLFTNDKTTESVFNMAYDYLMHQKENGFNINYFRGKMLPDEPFLSMSFAKHNIPPFQDYGRFSRCLNGTSDIHLNVIKRVSFFIAYGHRVNPHIVHFTGRFGSFLLSLESLKLYFYFNPPVRMLLLLILSLLRRFYKFFSLKKKENSS